MNYFEKAVFYISSLLNKEGGCAWERVILYVTHLAAKVWARGWQNLRHPSMQGRTDQAAEVLQLKTMAPKIGRLLSDRFCTLL